MRSLFGALVVLLSSCATTAAVSDDARLDDSAKEAAAKKSGRECGPDAPGDLILLDATTGGSVPCLPVTVTVGDSDVYFRGVSGPRGQVKLLAPVSRARLVAVADGFAPSELNNASTVKDRVLELELAPADGFWLKVLDAEGNYLQDVQLTFKQGADVIAQLRSNTLANVFFAGRQPFSGQPVVIEAAGFAPVTVSAVSELGDDGHTLTMTRQ
ncbi:MAG: hypothetical protein ACO1OB_03810 [Archangium sp.]